MNSKAKFEREITAHAIKVGNAIDDARRKMGDEERKIADRKAMAILDAPFVRYTFPIDKDTIVDVGIRGHVNERTLELLRSGIELLIKALSERKQP